MTDLLTPEYVRKMKGFNQGAGSGFSETIDRLCRNYLTLWDELANERSISDRLMERIAELEKSNAMALQIVEATQKLAEDNKMEE